MTAGRIGSTKNLRWCGRSHQAQYVRVENPKVLQFKEERRHGCAGNHGGRGHFSFGDSAQAQWTLNLSRGPWITWSLISPRIERIHQSDRGNRLSLVRLAANGIRDGHLIHVIFRFSNVHHCLFLVNIFAQFSLWRLLMQSGALRRICHPRNEDCALLLHSCKGSISVPLLFYTMLVHFAAATIVLCISEGETRFSCSLCFVF